MNKFSRVIAAVGVAVIMFGASGRLSAQPSFEQVSPNVFLFRDTCGVYLIRYGDKAIAIDCGDAAFLPLLSQIGVNKIEWALFTHHHRDQCQGIFKMIEHGAKVAVPKDEQRFFDQVEDFWRTEQIYKRTRFKPDFFVLRRSVSRVDKVLADGDKLSVGDVQIKAVHTPGHTPGHTSYVVTIGDKTIAFSGDLIHSPGKILNFYSLQYQYEDCGKRGAEETIRSLSKLAAFEPSVALPSHGTAITDLRDAAKQLEANLRPVVRYFSRQSSAAARRAELPPWLLCFEDLASNKWFQTYAIVDSEGNAFVVDPVGRQVAEDIIKDSRIKNVEMIWVSHYHFDHVEGVNFLKKHYGAKLCVQEKLVDVLENPIAYSIPCLVEEPIKVDKVLKHGESFDWRGIRFTAYDFPAHTYWHNGLLAAVEGKKYFFTGDALCSPRQPQNDNCRNYCRIEEDDGAIASASLLREISPQFLITGHWDMWQVDAEDFDYLVEYSRKIRPLAERVVAQPEVNMGMDERWASCYPYRTIAAAGSEIPLAVKLRNHLATDANAAAELRCPYGWNAAPLNCRRSVGQKKTGSLDFRVKIPPSVSPGRYVITANIIFADTNYGELAEAIIDVR